MPNLTISLIAITFAVILSFALGLCAGFFCAVLGYVGYERTKVAKLLRELAQDESLIESHECKCKASDVCKQPRIQPMDIIQ